jgi:outer membrane protein assembly factor BamD (BamD/ComL family)
MRRACLVLGLSLALVSQSFAQLPSQLELVRALRAAGLVDLAVERLNELKNKPGLLSPDEAKLIPLELARIKLEEASRETEDSRRASLIGQARTSFDEFIRNNPTHPMAAQANVEIARLYALQAKGQLSRANRNENGEAKALAFSLARPDFTTAINRYQGAITNLDNRIKGLDAKDPLAVELTRSRAQAELDAGVLQYELALTFIGDDERAQRGDGVIKAQKAFDTIASKYPNARIGYLASVWSWQCGFINGDEAKAVVAIEKFITANRGNREAADAVRLASYFGIEHIFSADNAKDTTPAAKFIRTEQAALRWLQTYPEAKNTPEGLGARYRRALMKEFQAFLPGGVIFQEPPKSKAPEKPKVADKSKSTAKEPEKEKEAAPVKRKIIAISPAAKQLLEDANKIYKELSETDNEYSERAHRKRLINQLVILEAEGKGDDPPLKAINTLEQAYLAAQVQQARMFDSAATIKDPAKLEEEEKRRVGKAIEYLERGLQRATPKDTPRDVFDAQMLLVNFLSKKDRAIEAAVLGEGLARNNPKMPRASVAAALAIFAYNSSLAKLKESPARSDEAESSDIRHIVELGQFAEKTWPNDGPTDAIRHVLAYYQENRDHNHELAWQTYNRIGAGYSEIYQARREMAGVMFYLIRPEERDPKKYRDALTANIASRGPQLVATLAALEALPDPPASVSEGHAEAWAGARAMQAQLYYMKGDYEKVDAIVKTTVDGLGRLSALDAKKRDDLAYTIRSLKYNALQGRAVEFIKIKEFAKVGETLGAELEALKKELKAPPPTEPPPNFERMRTAQRNFLITCMSAFVQNKQADQASELLDALQGAGGTLESNLATMRSLNATISGQLTSLIKEGKKQDADDLATTFTEFLDKIKGDDTSKLSSGVVLFLGQGYGAVNQHAKAAELFEQLVKKPYEPNPKKSEEENQELEAKHVGFVREMEYLQARALRQAGGKENFDKAMALMQKIVGDPLKKGVRGWGASNIAIRKEYCLLFEEQLNFNAAGNNWKVLTNEFVRGGLPSPIKFLGQRPAFVAFGNAADDTLLGAFLLPSRVSAFVDIGFKDVYPTVAARRNQLRLVYFDLFFEAYRCNARAYTTPAIVAKLPGGQDAANQKLADIGQKFFDLLTKNDDVQAEVKENIKELLEKKENAPMKKKFDELLATTPKTGG